MAITIKEIAAMAGVHRATVDKVLHGRAGVSDEVRQKVQSIIDQVGYSPNPVGRALQKQGDVFQIGVVLVEVDAMPYIRRGIERALAELRGFDAQVHYSICKFQGIREQVDAIDQLIRLEAHGIILQPINAEPVRQAVERAAEAGIPVITANSDLQNSRRLCNVGQDAFRASRVAGRLMGGLLGGKGTVAIVTSSIAQENNDYYVRVREQGFAAFLAEEYPQIRIAARIENKENPQAAYETTRKLLTEQPELDGLYVVGGHVAQVGRALRESGEAARIKLLCFEDYPEILALMRDGIVDCTLGSEIELQGYRPVQILRDYLLYSEKPVRQEQFTDIRILVKESCF